MFPPEHRGRRIACVYGADIQPFVGTAIVDLCRAVEDEGGEMLPISAERAWRERGQGPAFDAVYTFPFDVPLGLGAPAEVEAFLRQTFGEAPLVVPLELQELCWDKLATQERLLSQGVSMPDTLLTDDFDELRRFVREHRFVVLKQPQGCGGQGHLVLWLEDGRVVGDGGSHRYVLEPSPAGKTVLDGEVLRHPGPYYAQRLVAHYTRDEITPPQVLRAYVVDREIVFWTERYRTSYERPSDWIVNIGRGAQYRFLHDVGDATRKAAVRTAEVLGLRFGVVDLVRTAASGVYVLEADVDSHHMIVDRSFKAIPEYRDFFDFDRYIARSLVHREEEVAATPRPIRRPASERPPRPEVPVVVERAERGEGGYADRPRRPRPEESRFDRPRPDFDRPRRPRAEPGEDRGWQGRGERGDFERPRPRRDDDTARPPRRFDAPRSDGDRRPRAFDDRGDRPNRDFGDRTYRSYDDRRREARRGGSGQGYGPRAYKPRPDRIGGDEGRPYGPRPDLPRTRGPRGERDSRGYEPRGFSGRTQPRPYDDRPRGPGAFEDRPRGPRPFQDRGQGPRPYDDRQRGPRPFQDRGQGPRPYDDRPRGPGAFEDRPRGPRPFQDRGQGPRSYDDRPRGPRAFDDRPRGPRPFQDRGQGARPYDDRPRGPRAFEDRPRGPRPFQDRSQGPRPYGDRPQEGAAGERPRPRWNAADRRRRDGSEPPPRPTGPRPYRPDGPPRKGPPRRRD